MKKQIQHYLFFTLLLAGTLLAVKPIFRTFYSEAFAAESTSSSITTNDISAFCKKIDQSFLNWGWGTSKCNDFSWISWRKSALGDPLMWTVFGPDEKTKMDTTLIMCGVHGDEITPIKFCFDILQDLKERYAKDFSEKRVLIAPIVSPDSFFKEKPTRTNAQGIDVNRNFPTKDFNSMAMKLWVQKYRRDPRRFPGTKSNSEQETIFQVNLVKRYQPTKIISVHAPLTLLDYDGPGDESGKGIPQGAKAKEARELLIQMSESADGYKIKDYPYFPGSLGNWAGKELGIPVYTIELPDSDARRSKKYWDLFKGSIEKAIKKNLQ